MPPPPIVVCQLFAYLTQLKALPTNQPLLSLGPLPKPTSSVHNVAHIKGEIHTHYKHCVKKPALRSPRWLSLPKTPPRDSPQPSRAAITASSHPIDDSNAGSLMFPFPMENHPPLLHHIMGGLSDRAQQKSSLTNAAHTKEEINTYH